MKHVATVSRTVVDVVNRRIFGGRIEVSPTGRIVALHPEQFPEPGFIVPGFVDAHVHVESSMLTPTSFAREAVRHGTIAAVTDPHEIANVLGVSGVEFMLEEAARTPFLFATGAPSCVPATSFETAGAVLDAKMVSALLNRPDISHLSEMMNVPGVLSGDADILAKLEAAWKHGKPVDGHAPGLRGDDLVRYLRAGITTDHECLNADEAIEKAAAGMLIQLRRGSAARMFESLLPVLQRYPGACMFCSDDKHLDDLLQGYINDSVRIAVEAGIDLFDVLQAATLNPVRHYGLDMGLLQPGDRADWVEVENLQDFRVIRTVIGGQILAENGVSLLQPMSPLSLPNRFLLQPVAAGVFHIQAQDGSCRVIGVRDGELVTDSLTCIPTVRDGAVIANPQHDQVKLAVFNRYAANAPPALALASGLGLERGAMAASVAHDSHHVIVAGTDDFLMAEVVNAVIAHGGGLAATDGWGEVRTMPLPVAGLMSIDTCAHAAAAYARITDTVRGCGCRLHAPFMTLSFLALPVIPALKLTDQGLFDGERFQPTAFWCAF